MNLKRVWTLIKNEILHGPKDVVLVMSVVTPVLLALFANLDSSVKTPSLA